MAAPATHVRVSGAWKQTKKQYVRVGGSWKPVKAGYVRTGGTWKKIFSGSIQLSNSSVVANYNLFTAAGSPAGPVNVVFTNTGTIYSTSTASAALITTGFAAGSTVTIINQGYIQGAPGAGGAGGTWVAGSPGGAGGPAISFGCNTTIDNSAGYIFGGGGGGGGGGSYWESGAGFQFTGGNGGAGQGSSGGPYGGGAGGYGSGIGNGGAGGAWGTAGSAGHPGSTGSGAGGAGGKAINLNGYSVTWLGGNDSTHVKGVVS